MSRKVLIVVPTWNNMQFLTQSVRSLRERTEYDSYRLIVVPNGCNDGTVQWLQKEGVQFVALGAPSGFIKSTNAGLAHAEDDEHVLLLNDDVRITDPQWLTRLVSNFDDPTVGAVGPTCNFILGTQDFRLDRLPPKHETPFLIGLCFLIRNEVFRKVGLLDEAFGIGTNEDLDYSMAIRAAGYKLIVDRSVFLYHYGSRSLTRVAENGNLDNIQLPTREVLKAKWGEAKCAEMMAELRAVIELSRTGGEVLC